MPIIRTHKGALLNGEEAFKLWAELGSTVKVTQHYNREGVRNRRTGRPVSQMTVWMTATKWVIENPELARPYYIEAGAMTDDDEWEMYLIRKAFAIYKNRYRFIHWAKTHNLFEKWFWSFSTRYGLTEDDLKYYRDNPVDIRGG